MNFLLCAFCLVISLLTCYQIDGHSGYLMLQRGEKAKKERKEKKRERKKEEKKRRNGELKDEKQSHKKRHKRERSQDDQKGQEHRKRRKYEMGQVEKSGLTEEHGHPVNSQNLCNSSDSTLNSESRQKQSSPSNARHNNGSIVRIRMAAHMQKDAEALLPCNEEKPDLRCGEEVCEQPCSTSGIVSQNIDLKLTKDKSCSPSGSSKILSQKAQTALPSSYLKFRDLIENWVPPLSQSYGIDLNDQEWLFPVKQKQTLGAERFKGGNDGLTLDSSTPFIYALPYVVPL